MPIRKVDIFDWSAKNIPIKTEELTSDAAKFINKFSARNGRMTKYREAPKSRKISISSRRDMILNVMVAKITKNTIRNWAVKKAKADHLIVFVTLIRLSMISC